MKKYVLSAAYELDGHAGSTAAYLQVDDVLTYTQSLHLIEEMFCDDSTTFEPTSAQPENVHSFYGELVTTFKEGFVNRTAIAIRLIPLPSKLQKNKIYLTESRTG